MTRLKNSRGFTLIELIVVIVIIGILVALAAVAYNAVIANSKKSAVEATGAQVAKMIQSESAAQQKAADATVVGDIDFDAEFPDNVEITPGATSTEVVKDGFTVIVTYDGNGDGATAGEAPSVSDAS